MGSGLPGPMADRPLPKHPKGKADIGAFAAQVRDEPIPDLPVHAQQRALRRYNASDFCYGAFLGHRWSNAVVDRKLAAILAADAVGYSAL
jgi:hypothetical protein